jgi:hypothetical protein
MNLAGGVNNAVLRGVNHPEVQISHPMVHSRHRFTGTHSNRLGGQESTLAGSDSRIVRPALDIQVKPGKADCRFDRPGSKREGSAKNVESMPP